MITIGGVAFACVLLAVMGIHTWVERSSARRIYLSEADIPDRPVALVLGTIRRLANGHTNLFFTHRIEAAAHLYHSGKVQKLLVSGDNSRKGYDEPTDMRDALIENGVPEADIILDYAGFSTLDSVVRARDVFGQDDLIIVSQQFHLERAIFIAKCKNIQVLGYVAKDPPHRRNYIKVRGRECLARVKAALDCYVLVTKPHFPGPPEPIQLQPDPGNRPSSSPNG